MPGLCNFIIVLFLFLFQPCYPAQLPQGAYLSAKKWHLCEQFIKTEAPAFFSKGITYIPRGPTHPCSIEQDAATGAIYIHLKGKKKAFIGEGGFKFVTKSILYGETPELVARCQGDRTLQREAEVLRKLRRTRGIVPLKSFIVRPNGRASLMIKYFNSGSLRGLGTGKLIIKEEELLPIMRDLIIVLKNLHKAGYIHRDLHRSNILFNHENGVLRAALTDFGLALKMKERPDSRVSVQDGTCSPEVLLKQYRCINRKKAEAYSLGVLLYYLIFGERPVWSNVIKQADLIKDSQSKKNQLFRSIQARYKETISNASRAVSIRNDLALLTFKLLNPNPKKRIYLDKARINIDAIAKKWRVKSHYKQ